MSKIKTRDKLLDAGYIEIYKHGYQGASIDAILTASSVPKGSLYHYFKSKKALALAVIDERLSPKMLWMMDNVDKNAAVLEQIFSLIDFIGSVDYLLTSGCPLSKLIAEMSPLDQDFEAHLSPIHEGVHQRLEKMLQRAIEVNEIVLIDSSSLATFIIASIWGNISLGKGVVTQVSYQKSVSHLKNYLHSLKK